MVLYPYTRLLGNFLYNVQGSTDWIILTLGKGNIFTSVCQSFCPQTETEEGHLCMMSPPVWLPGPMFLLPGICAWSHVPSQGSVSKGSLSRESVSKDVSLSRGRGLCPGGSLSRGVSVQRSLSEGLSPRMCLCPGGEVIV